MADIAHQFRIPELPETKGALGLPGTYIRALSDILPRGVVDARVVAEEGRLLQVGETISGVVVFIDIGSFTKRSAELTPRQTAYLVNKFFVHFGPLCESVHATFDKTMGDCGMFVFSEALGCSSPRESALKLAVAIVDFDPWSYDPHVGLAAGDMWLGLNGPPQSMALSVYGSTVNLAARLLARSDGNTIMLPTDYWRSVEGIITLPQSFKVEHKISPDAPSGEIGDFIKDFPGLSYTMCMRTSVWGPVMG